MVTTITEIRGVNNDTTLTPSSSDWVVAKIVAIRQETATTKTFRFLLPHPAIHEAGQHYEIRLTAPSGYQAARLYSAASASDGSNEVELTIVLLPGGEVSTYMHQTAKVGDDIELRGPLGKFFVWRPTDNLPTLLIAGGSGVVPMRCMLQSYAAHHATSPIRLLYSVRTDQDIIYRAELFDNPNVTVTATRESSASWRGMTGRITPELLRQTIGFLPPETVCYVCGATPFVEAMADMLVQIGVDAARVKTERFGATK